MASMAGAHQGSSTQAKAGANIHALVAKAIAAHKATKALAAVKATHASAQKLPLPASLAHLAAHDTVSSLQHTLATHDTVASAAHAPASGFEAVTAVSHATFAGASKPATEKVVATQTVHKDGTTVHFTDGSTIHIAGTTHLQGGFFHH